MSEPDLGALLEKAREAQSKRDRDQSKKSSKGDPDELAAAQV